MGLFSYFRDRRARESAIPGSVSEISGNAAGLEPPSPEPDVQMTNRVLDLRGTGAREEILDVLRRHGLDAEEGEGEGASAGAADVPAADLGEVAGLIAATLKQGNITVSADGKVVDLRGTALHGQAFEPVDLPGEDPDEPDAGR